MQSLNKWRLIHTYNKMAGEDRAEIIRCPNDDHPLYTQLDHTDPNEPVFHCMICRTNLRLGLDAWDQILQTVRMEYDVELVD